jgi:hypothetical protein
MLSIETKKTACPQTKIISTNYYDELVSVFNKTVGIEPRRCTLIPRYTPEKLCEVTQLSFTGTRIFGVQQGGVVSYCEKIASYQLLIPRSGHIIGFDKKQDHCFDIIEALLYLPGDNVTIQWINAPV